MAAPFEKFIQVANFFYTTIAVQPYRDFEKPTNRRNVLLLKLTFYAMTINLNVQALGMAAFIYQAFKQKTAFIDAIVTGASIGFVVVSECKLISVWYKKKPLTELISELRRIHPKTLEEQKAYSLNSYLQQVTRVTVMFSILFLVLMWSFNLIPLVKYVYCKSMGLEHQQKFPYNIHLPWEWHDNAWYWVVNLCQNVGAQMAVAAIISSDTMLCSLVTLVCMHFDHLAQQLEDYVPEGGERDMKFMGTMISNHQKFLHFSDQISSIFGIPLLLNFATSSMILCFVGFQVTVGLASDELFKFVLYLLSALIQVYLICYYGEMLTHASGNIAQALYKQVWYLKTSTSYRKCILCVMHRAQVPLHLQATVFLPVSMNVFTAMGQLSYKFFTLLNTMYAH